MTPYLTNNTHAIIIERIAGNTWLELVDRASGSSRIMMFKSRAKAIEFIRDMTIDAIIQLFDRLRIESTPMYKKGVI